MEFLIKLALFIHIATGSVALLTGIIPMVVQKGGKLHNRAGLFYVRAMIIMAASAMLLCLIQPFTLFRLFLVGIAVFSFYLSFTGWRAVRQKRKNHQLSLIDRLLPYGAMLTGLSMVGFGLWLISQASSFMSILFTFFGALTAFFGFQDWRRMGGTNEKMAWLFLHFTRMGGSYISAFTAFVVVNNGRMLPAGTPDWVYLAGWIAPTFVGGAIIGATVARYKKRFEMEKG